MFKDYRTPARTRHSRMRGGGRTSSATVGGLPGKGDGYDPFHLLLLQKAGAFLQGGTRRIHVIDDEDTAPGNAFANRLPACESEGSPKGHQPLPAAPLALGLGGTNPPQKRNQRAIQPVGDDPGQQFCLIKSPLLLPGRMQRNIRDPIGSRTMIDGCFGHHPPQGKGQALPSAILEQGDNSPGKIVVTDDAPVPVQMPGSALTIPAWRCPRFGKGSSAAGTHRWRNPDQPPAASRTQAFPHPGPGVTTCGRGTKPTGCGGRKQVLPQGQPLLCTPEIAFRVIAASDQSSGILKRSPVPPSTNPAGEPSGSSIGSPEPPATGLPSARRIQTRLLRTGNRRCGPHGRRFAPAWGHRRRDDRLRRPIRGSGAG